jgi:cytosine/adenosine deaminase-related metal-dependent hydrolase
LTLFRKIGIGLAALAAVVAVAAYVLASIHVERIWGGLVERVDPGEFDVAPALTAITNVSVLSASGDSMVGPRTVVFDGDGIVAVSSPEAPSGAPPDGARVIDGTGKFLIPGLVDAHVHLRRQPNDLLLYLVWGVTHVRDLSGSELTLSLRDEVESGRMGPRIDAASPLLFTTGRLRGWFTEWSQPRRNVRDPGEAAAVMRSLAEQGYDALKTYADLELETYRALNAAAREAGLHTVGHLPDGFRLEELATTEQGELAHVEEVVKKLQDEFDPETAGPYEEAFPGYVASRADEVIDHILAHDLTVNSTLWFSEVVGRQAFHLEAELQQLPIEYANPGMIEGSPYVSAVGWLPGRNQFEDRETAAPEERARVEASWEARAEAHRVLFRRMVERGVRITAGTDATTNLVIPGVSMHAELESLVRNGMTPAQSLRAATAIPARLMGSSAGSIEVGRRADLVLLSANPLEDISNTTRIEAVIAGGKVLDRVLLDRILARLEEVNTVSRRWELSRFRTLCRPAAGGRPGVYVPASEGCEASGP